MASLAISLPGLIENTKKLFPAVVQTYCECGSLLSTIFGRFNPFLQKYACLFSCWKLIYIEDFGLNILVEMKLNEETISASLALPVSTIRHVCHN